MHKHVIGTVVGDIAHGFQPIVGIAKLSNHKRIVLVFSGIAILKPMLVSSQVTSHLCFCWREEA